jgi:hypothetical protein
MTTPPKTGAKLARQMPEELFPTLEMSGHFEVIYSAPF